MNANISLVLIPHFEQGHCGCGGSCGPAVSRTEYGDAVAAVETLAKEFGGDASVKIGKYDTREDIEWIVKTLEEVFSAGGGGSMPRITSNSVGRVLEDTAPILIMNGSVIAYRNFPPVSRLAAVIREALSEKKAAGRT